MTDGQKDVSVIVPTYRRQESLRRLLDSLSAGETGATDFEVIVVDDRSGEDLEPVIGPYREKMDIRGMATAAPACCWPRRWTRRN